MCVKLPPEDLNLDPYPPYPTSTYTCGVTIAPRVYNGNNIIFVVTQLIGLHNHVAFISLCNCPIFFTL